MGPDLYLLIALLRLTASISVEVHGKGQVSQLMRQELPARGEMSSATVHGKGEVSQLAAPKRVIQQGQPAQGESSGANYLRKEAAPQQAHYPRKVIRHEGPVQVVMGATPSRNALPKGLSKIHHVPGHLALKHMIEVEYAAISGVKAEPQIWTCDQVFMEARNLVTDHIQDTNDDQYQPLLARINAKNMSDDNLHEFEDVLDHMNLGDALTHGDAWTIDHAAVWAACNANLSKYNEDGTNPLEDGYTINGVQMCQGDELPTTADGSCYAASLVEGIVKHKRVVATSNLWPMDTPIAYCFASDISTAAKTAINAAVVHIMEQVPCVQFEDVGRSATQEPNAFANTVQENCAKIPSVIIQSHLAGCWAAVGLVSGVSQFSSSSQPINIGKGCEDLGIAAHELGHTIGLLHEMSRTDRAKYLKINEKNIPPKMMLNFEMDAAADVEFGFDFLSLMMYGSFAFSSDGGLTVEPHDLRLVNYMGQRMGFSELDIELIGGTYGCLNTVNPKTRNAALSKAYLKGDGHDVFEGDCEDAETTGYTHDDGSPMSCPGLAPFCAHEELGEQIRELCPVSCYLCVTAANRAPLGSKQPATKSPGQQKGGAEYACGRPHLLGLLLVIFTLLVAGLA